MRDTIKYDGYVAHEFSQNLVVESLRKAFLLCDV